MAHLITVVVCGALAVCAYRVGQALRHINRTTAVAVGIAVSLVALELFKTWQAFVVYEQLWQEVLPLHLCSISSYLCSVMLILRSYRLFEVAYFWGIGGSVAAMMTPDLMQGFPHPFYLGFFAGHTLVLISVLFAVSGFDYRPRLRSIGFTAVVTAVYMALVAMINWVLQTNYLYLCHKPEQLTIYHYLGPWPWYIVSVWIIGLVVAFICFAPFVQRNRTQQLLR